MPPQIGMAVKRETLPLDGKSLQALDALQADTAARVADIETAAIAALGLDAADGWTIDPTRRALTRILTPDTWRPVTTQELDTAKALGIPLTQQAGA